jgi:murein DD-endopeptidase MepM/ murein hydrolase activator NlpD
MFRARKYFLVLSSRAIILSSVFFLLILFFSPDRSYGNTFIFLDSNYDGRDCVIPGGIVFSFNKISDLYFDFDGKKIFFYPVPLTASYSWNGVKVCDYDFPVEKITLRKRIRRKGETEEDLASRIKNEKRFLSQIYNRISQRMWDGNFILPAKNYKSIKWNFGNKREINGYLAGQHKGIDISAPRGTPVFASNSGIVAVARRFTLEGKLVVIDHGTGIFSIYAHLSRIHVREGDFVRKGQIIGRVGSTGRSTAPHLHFGIKVKGTDVNPEIFMKISEVLKFPVFPD